MSKNVQNNLKVLNRWLLSAFGSFGVVAEGLDAEVGLMGLLLLQMHLQH
jgi:hypothetical protein